MTKEEALLLLTKKRAIRDFWSFVRYIDSDDTMKERETIFKGLADQLTNFENVEETQQVNHFKINLACFPRAGKSYLNSLLCAWLIGRDPERKIMSISATDDLTKKLLANVKNIMSSKRYRELFPNVEIVNSSANELGCRTRGNPIKKPQTFFATSINGQITGFGTNILILDDIYKSHEEAFSETTNSKIKDIYFSAIDSRLEGMKRLEIHIGTRWSDDELVADLEKMGYYDIQLKVPCYDEETKESIYPKIHTTDKLERVKKYNELVFYSEYQQDPKSSNVKLFQRGDFKQVYNFMPNVRMCVVDTADKGTDYFSAGMFNVQNGESMVLEDVLFDKRPMETTEDRLVAFCKFYRPNVVFIEENFDRSFVRNIKARLKPFKILVKEIKTSNQMKKHTKIFNATARIKRRVILNENAIENRAEYVDFMENVYLFSMNSVEHDDAPDVLAMSIDMLELHYENYIQRRHNV